MAAVAHSLGAGPPEHSAPAPSCPPPAPIAPLTPLSPPAERVERAPRASALAWQWREGRLLALELVYGFLLTQHMAALDLDAPPSSTAAGTSADARPAASAASSSSSSSCALSLTALKGVAGRNSGATGGSGAPARVPFARRQLSSWNVDDDGADDAGGLLPRPPAGRHALVALSDLGEPASAASPVPSPTASPLRRAAPTATLGRRDDDDSKAGGAPLPFSVPSTPPLPSLVAYAPAPSAAGLVEGGLPPLVPPCLRLPASAGATPTTPLADSGGIGWTWEVGSELGLGGDDSLGRWLGGLTWQPLRLCLQHTLLHATTCYADREFELRRMGEQLLKPLCDVAMWVDLPALVQFWLSFLPLVDTLPCWVGASTLLRVLQRTAAHEADEANGHAAAGALVARVLEALPALAPLVAHLVERAAVTKVVVVAAQTLMVLHGRFGGRVPALRAHQPAHAAALLRLLHSTFRDAHPTSHLPAADAPPLDAMSYRAASHALTLERAMLLAVRGDLAAFAHSLRGAAHRAALAEWLLAHIRLPADAPTLPALLDALEHCLEHHEAAHDDASDGAHQITAAPVAASAAPASKRQLFESGGAPPLADVDAPAALVVLGQLAASPAAAPLAVLRPCLLACRPALTRVLPTPAAGGAVAALLRDLCACLRGGAAGVATGGGASPSHAPRAEADVAARMAALLDGASEGAAVKEAPSTPAVDEDDAEDDWDDWDDEDDEEESAEAGPRMVEEVGELLRWLGGAARTALLEAVAGVAEADGALLCASVQAGRAVAVEVS